MSVHDETPLEDDSILQEPPIRTAKPRRGASAGLLFFLGFCMALGGAALLAAPSYSWKVQQVGISLQSYGLSYGTLFVGGLILIALASVARGVNSIAGAVHADAEADPGLDRLSEKLSGVCDTVVELSQRVAALGEEQQQVQQVLRQAQEAEAAADSKENGMFRLAASLDQLGATVEQSMHTELGAVRQTVEALQGEMRQLELRAAASVARAQTSAAPAAARAAAPAPAAEAPAPAAATPPAPSNAPAAGAAPAQAAAVPAPAAAASKGVFEEADDEPTMVVAEPTEDLEVLVELEEDFDDQPVLDFFDQLDDPDRDREEDPPPAPTPEPPAALPSKEPKAEDEGPPGSWERSIDKLLPEESVRRALEKGTD